MLSMLNVAKTGLSVSQTQVENVMNNLANENTEGYTKRIVNTSELEQSNSSLTGRGVSTDSVTRVTDIYMYNKIVNEESEVSDLTTLNTMLNSIESVFFETDDSGLSSDINNYFNAIENLKTSPNDAIYKAELTNSATILVNNMKDLYTSIENLENDILEETKTTVDSVNDILKSIGEVNQSISETSSLASANDLYDKRDALEKELASYVDIEVSKESDYQIKIGGMTAVRFNSQVSEITLTEDYIPQGDAYLKVDDNGNIDRDLNGDVQSNLIDASTWGSDIDLTLPESAEIQHIPISGGLPTAAGQELEVLGYTITGIDNSAGIYDNGDSSKLEALITTEILGNSAAIISNWNSQPENVNKQIVSLSSKSSDASGDQDILVIEYDNATATTGDVPDIQSSTSNGLQFDTSIEMTRGGDTSAVSEVQTLQLEGTTTGQAYFLGTAITGSVSGQDAITTATNIAADATNIIENWNNDPDNAAVQIESIVADTNGELTITYKAHMADVSIMEETSSRGITYNKSEELIQGAPEDTITYTLNNEYSISVTNGETIYEADGITLSDINGDGVADENDIVDQNNAIQALVYKINQDDYIGATVKAYNGKYELDEDGDKILTNNPLHSEYDPSDPNKDRYLYIEATEGGEDASFIGEIVVNDNDNIDTYHEILNPDGTDSYMGVNVSADNSISQEALNDIHLSMYEEEIEIDGGMLNAMINNLKTDSGENSFNEYKEMLDNLAKTLSDYSSDYIEVANGEYVYGRDASEIDTSGKEITSLGLFIGADVNSLEFQENSINNLDQADLDYLSSIQWKDDISFNKEGKDTFSFSEYYQALRVNIADTRENVIFSQESHEAVSQSLQSSYDKLTKVDSDEEMIELIKYQSAYEANAKMITVVDELLQTLLNM